MSSPVREIEYDCIANAKFEQAADNATVLSKAATVRLSPEQKKHWKSNTHFHPDFCLHDDHGDGSLLLQFEGRAREGLAVSLSTAPKFKGTEIVFGATGNTSTVLSHKKKRFSAPGRVCREDVWVNYWVCWESNNMLFAGIGLAPGEQCIAILDTNRKEAEETVNGGEKGPDNEEKKVEGSMGTEEVKGDEASNEQKAESSKTPVPMRYVGVRNAGTADRQAPKPLQVRNFRLITIPNEIAAQLSTLDADNLDMIILGEEELQGSSLTSTDRETVEALCKYRDECVKAKARSVKFGIPYQPPALTATMPWSQARRLRANPVASSGFVTGMDLQADAEKEKQEKRKARFGISTELQENTQETTDMTMNEASVLPVEQAWDKEELVQSQRVDPPPSLWKIPPSSLEDATKDDFRMEEAEEPVVLPEKVHVFSIDWAAFKQIRTNDILAHFSSYGPSYVEWLGDLSCNVLFEDKYSAARAMENMSQELPSPPPTLSKEEDDAVGGEAAAANGNDASGPPDLGRMGWRFGKTMLRKVSNDRYGRRGTTARLLMRTATSLDILHERPSKWPKPPPGFTTDRVLGPESDLVGRGKKKAKKRDRNNDRNARRKPVTAEGLLSEGLSSGRAGFSVEEMEAERAKKRSKVSES